MKSIFIANYICRAVAFICITLVAIHFEKTSLLWWYILPFLMDISYKRRDNDA